jgi:hypothetical protein
MSKRNSILAAIKNIDSNPSEARDILFDLFYEIEEVPDYYQISQKLSDDNFQDRIAQLMAKGFRNCSSLDNLSLKIGDEINNELTLSAQEKIIAFTVATLMINGKTKKQFYNAVQTDQY